jgi:excisionase family DNA binding protein
MPEAIMTEEEKSKSSRGVERIFLTFQETQDFLGVSHQTVYKLMQQGLPSHKIGKKRVFLKDDLTRWIKEH